MGIFRRKTNIVWTLELTHHLPVKLFRFGDPFLKIAVWAIPNCNQTLFFTKSVSFNGWYPSKSKSKIEGRVSDGKMRELPSDIVDTIRLSSKTKRNELTSGIFKQLSFQRHLPVNASSTCCLKYGRIENDEAWVHQLRLVENTYISERLTNSFCF